MTDLKNLYSFDKIIFKETESSIAIQINEIAEKKYQTPFYLKIFSKLYFVNEERCRNNSEDANTDNKTDKSERFYNRTGEPQFNDFSKCYVIKTAGKYICKVTFEDPSDYFVFVYDNKGETVLNEYIDWEADIYGSKKGFVKLTENDTMLRPYIFVADYAFESNDQYSPVANSLMSRDSTRFVMVDLLNSFRIYGWFASNQMTTNLYNFVRSMCDDLKNDNKFLLLDHDTHLMVPKNTTIGEALRPKNKGSTRSRFSLIVIGQKKTFPEDTNFIDEVFNDIVDKKQTSTIRKHNNESIALHVIKATGDFKVTVWGCGSSNLRIKAANVSFKSGYHDGYTIKEGEDIKYKLYNHVNEDGFTHCYLEFVPLKKHSSISFRWAAAVDKSWGNDSIVPDVCGNYFSGCYMLSIKSEDDFKFLPETEITLSKEKGEYTTVRAQVHVYSPVVLNVIDMEEGAKFLVRVHGSVIRKGPNLTYCETPNHQKFHVDGYVIDSPGTYHIPNSVRMCGFVACYLELVPLNDGEKKIKFTWATRWNPKDKINIPKEVNYYGQKIFF